jgi:hypothetical protein
VLVHFPSRSFVKLFPIFHNQNNFKKILFFLANINVTEKTVQLPKEVEGKVVIDLMQEQSIHLQSHLKLSAFGFRLLVIKK